jgi:putative CocE/NonD family hydrolase
MKARLFVLFTLALCHTVFGDIKTETVSVPMRDGIKLATDVYRDENVNQAPVILLRTPYDRTKQKATGERWAKAGYIFVTQDCRGTRESEGVMAPYNNEGQDGFDTIEWITRQSWCTGRVGMTGGSYVGAVQWQAAAEQPPGLVAIAPQATWSSFYRNLYLGGAVRLSLISGWLAGNTPKPEGVKPADMNEALLRLPLSDVDVAIGWSMPWLDAYLTHPEPNGFWTRLDLTDELPSLKMPALHVVGYYDFFSRESVGNFMIMQKQAHDPKTRQQQRLILGPWDHGTVGKSTVGEVDFGPDALVDLFTIQLDWFDRHLKQDPAAIAKPFTPVRYFSMGDNVWHDAQTWPPEGFVATSFYLHSDKKANTRNGSGKLNRQAPTAEEPVDMFRADPANPVPACPVTEKRPMKAAVWGPVDQSPLEDRDDVLVYTSETFPEPLSFAGNIEAKLFVSADTPDADWAVKLVDVRPDGYAQNIATGILRGRYRDSLLQPSPLEANKVYEVTVDLGPCAATIAKGHRLRVDICGSLFPLYDRNPNTGEGPFGAKTLVSTESVYHSPLKASRIVLPLQTRRQEN